MLRQGAQPRPYRPCCSPLCCAGARCPFRSGRTMLINSAAWPPVSPSTSVRPQLGRQGSTVSGTAGVSDSTSGNPAVPVSDTRSRCHGVSSWSLLRRVTSSPMGTSTTRCRNAAASRFPGASIAVTRSHSGTRRGALLRRRMTAGRQTLLPPRRTSSTRGRVSRSHWRRSHSRRVFGLGFESVPGDRVETVIRSLQKREPPAISMRSRAVRWRG